MRMKLPCEAEAVAQRIREAETIAIISHVNPDGDAVGSALAMRLGLLKLNKQVSLFCQDPVPQNLQGLPGARLYSREMPEGSFDLVLSIDVSDDGRLGSFAALKAKGKMTACIDHHGTNPGMMQVNYVAGEASAAALPVMDVLKLLGVSLDREMAGCLYTAISTDTGNFSFSNVHADTFAAMTEIMETGFSLQDLNRLLFRERPRAQVQLLGRALNSLTFHHEDQVTVMTLTQKDFEDCHALQEHADTVVNQGLDIRGVKAAMLLRETPDGRVKISLRAVAPWRIDKVASAFGGGGHAQASGITMAGTLEECREAVLKALIAAVEEQA